MNIRIAALVFSLAGIGGCSTFGASSYCAAELESNVAAMRNMTDQNVRSLVLGSSQAEYGGECACPYDKDSSGVVCGDRSAHTRTGGRAPYCFAEEVPASALPAMRSFAAHAARPIECGGTGNRSILEF